MMPSAEDFDYDGFRAGLAAYRSQAPTALDLDQVRRAGRRRRRARRFAVVGSGLTVAVVTTVVVSSVGLTPGGERVGSIGAVATAAPTAPAIAGEYGNFGTVGGYEITYLPTTTIKPARVDLLAFRGGRCSELPALDGSVFGCWSPAHCLANAPVDTNSSCNSRLTLHLGLAGDGTDPHAGTAGQPPTVTSDVTVAGRPGELLTFGNGFFTSVDWRLPDGRVALAQAANYSTQDVLRFAESLRPAPRSRTADAAPTAARLSNAPACTGSDLHAGPAAAIEVLAGEQDHEIPLFSDRPCTVSIADLTVIPDADVAVTRTGEPSLEIAVDGTVTLNLIGESDGFCHGHPTTRNITIGLAGTTVTRLPLADRFGLCTGITASLAATPLTGQTPACSAHDLTGALGHPDVGNGTQQADVYLRYHGARPCELLGYPIRVSGVHADGSSEDLRAAPAPSSANGLVLQPGGDAFVGVGGLNAFACSTDTNSQPRRVGTYTEVTITIASGDIDVTTARGLAFPCGKVTTTAFSPYRTWGASPTADQGVRRQW